MNENFMADKEVKDYAGIFKRNFGFFGGGILLYSCFYAFCMFRNPSGVSFPFFIAGSLLFFCLCIAKLGISLQKGSRFYMISMMLLAISVFLTDDSRILSMNKWGIFLLMMSLLVNQFCDTSSWQLGKYAGVFLQMIICATGMLARPFIDAGQYCKSFEKGKGNKVFYAVGGFFGGATFIRSGFLAAFKRRCCVPGRKQTAVSRI